MLMGNDRTITAIEAQKRNHQRVNIHLDGEYAFSLDRMSAVWLAVGKRLSKQEITDLQANDEIESAYTGTLNLLSRRARSSKELERYMQGKGYAAETIARVLARLKEDGFLNDERFAQDWIANRSAFRPRSKSLLRQELRLKGVDKDLIEESLNNADLDEYGLSLQLGRKMLRRYLNLNKDIFKLRLGNALRRRGFDYETASKTVETLWNEISNT